MLVSTTYYIDEGLIETISDKLKDAGFKATRKMIKKIIKDGVFFRGDAFIHEPTLWESEEEKENFIYAYTDSGFKLVK